ncbi:MAG: hypothetical protein GC181_10985 [Bacteroidetes bacterium]|nr:hypothetical protein [Bacteroidota bacterium]
MQIEIKSKLDFNTFRNAIFYISYKRWIIRIITLAGFAAIIYSFSDVGSNSNKVWFWFGIYVIVVIPIIQYWKCKKAFKPNSPLTEETVYHFDENAVRITGSSFNTELKWTNFIKLEFRKDYVLLYRTPVMAHVIQRDPMESAFMQLKQLASAHITVVEG